MSKQNQKQNPVFTKPILTIDKFTAENALRVLTSPWLGVNGLCTAADPWGQQCTAYLKDGTPVSRNAFVIAVLKYLTGDKNAAYEHIKKWEDDVRQVATLTLRAA